MTALNKSIRGAFIKSVMNDVPEVDYNEQIRKLIQADYVAQMPPAIAAVYKDEKLRSHLNVQTLHPNGDWNHSVAVYTPRGNPPDMTKETRLALEGLVKASEAQSVERNQLRAKLYAVVMSVRTIQQLAEQLPEFAKYLPEALKPQDRTVPAIANLMADMSRAGWPKDRKPEQAKRTPDVVASNNGKKRVLKKATI